jgi:2-succinyl-6-hydroxy-2,4-cyclohexadiene-1-carboxylate synthase
MIHCLHGAVGSHRDWDIFRDQLGHEITALDLWSLFQDATPSLEEAGTLISDRAAPGDIIIGYSMGGRLALHALLATPEKWRAAVIISAHPGMTRGHEDRLVSDACWGRLADRDWEYFLTKWNAQSILTPSSGLHQASLQDKPSVALSFKNWSLGTQKDLLPQLKKITCPVLWVSGKEDQKFTQLGVQATASIPIARHEIVSHCGHRVPWEQPGKFSLCVRSFLTSI